MTLTPTLAPRIERAPACLVVDLAQDEYVHYTGAGLRLALVENGKIAALHNPFISDDAPMDDAVSWLQAHQGAETWLVNCTCYQLCEPLLISADDDRSLVDLMNRIDEHADEFGT